MANEITSFTRVFLDEAPSRSVEENWIIWRRFICDTSHHHSPRKAMHGGKRKVPWIQENIRKSIKKKQRLFSKAKATRSESDWEAFKFHRNSNRNIIRDSFASYVERVFNDEKDFKKRFFKIISTKNKTPNGISMLIDENQSPVYEAQDIAKVLASSFGKTYKVDAIGQTLHPTLPLHLPDMDDFLCTEQGILKLLLKLDPSKAMGPDGIHPRILKECATQIAPSLTFIVNPSISEGVVPSDWRDANIIPIYKKGSRADATNYRPVSMTSIPSKIAEHIFVAQLMDHLDRYDALTCHQFGFRPGFGTESQLLTCVNEWQVAIDDGFTIDIIIYDFAKAFDKVRILLLLYKSSLNGIRGNYLRWLASFLSFRRQRVIVQGVESDWYSTESGVPQGSVLGPILFLIFVNDIVLVIQSSKFIFADDLLISRTIKKPQDKLVLQKDIDAILKWSEDWSLPLNEDKCRHLHISLKKPPSTDTYFLGPKPITKVDTITYLGITITSNLSFSDHITSVCNKASRTLGMLKRSLHTCQESIKEKAFKSIILPRLEYASAVWDPVSETDIHRLDMIQRRGARFVKNLPRFTRDVSISRILTNLKWPTLAQRRKKRRLLIFKGLVLKTNASLKTLEKELSYKPSCHSLRNHHPLALFQPFARTDIRRNGFLFKSLREWNSLLSVSQI